MRKHCFFIRSSLQLKFLFAQFSQIWDGVEKNWEVLRFSKGRGVQFHENFYKIQQAHRGLAKYQNFAQPHL